MKWILASAAIWGVLWSQTSPNSPQPTRSAMAASLERQRVSVQRQVISVTGRAAPPAESFFTVAWMEPAVARFVPPPCDPLATQEVDQLIEQNSEEEGVKPDLIRAVINQESGNRPCAVSSKGAQGLMQLMPATAAQFGAGDPFDPKQNVEAGTKLLKQLLGKYNENIELALAAYNAGSSRVDSVGGVPPLPETLNYVDQIMAKLPKR
jgi:soluble lytic murein transglycosylase-like protein